MSADTDCCVERIDGARATGYAPLIYSPVFVMGITDASENYMPIKDALELPNPDNPYYGTVVPQDGTLTVTVIFSSTLSASWTLKMYECVDAHTSPADLTLLDTQAFSHTTGTPSEIVFAPYSATAGDILMFSGQQGVATSCTTSCSMLWEFA